MIDVKKLIIKQQIQISCFQIFYHTTSFIDRMDKKIYIYIYVQQNTVGT